MSREGERSEGEGKGEGVVRVDIMAVCRSQKVMIYYLM